MKTQRQCKITIKKEGDYVEVYHGYDRVAFCKVDGDYDIELTVDSVIYESETHTKDSYSLNSLAELTDVSIEHS